MELLAYRHSLRLYMRSGRNSARPFSATRTRNSALRHREGHTKHHRRSAHFNGDLCVLLSQLERKITRVVRVSAVLLVSSVLFFPGRGDAKTPCYAPRQVGGWIGSSGDQVTNEIKKIEAVKNSGDASILGWLFQLENGQLYFQPALKYETTTKAGRSSVLTFRMDDRIRGGIALRISSSTTVQVVEAMHRYLASMGERETALPSSWRTVMTGKTRIVVALCK